MAFDQTSLPMDVRPINIARTVAEEPRIVPVTATGRIPDAYCCNPAREVVSPNSVPVLYPGTISEAGYVGLQYANVAPGVAAWCPRVPAPVGHSSMSPAVAFAYNAPLGNRVVGGATELASSGIATAVCTPNLNSPNLGNRMGGNGVDPSSHDIAGHFDSGQNLGNRVIGTDQPGNDPSTGFTYSPLLGNQTGSNGADQASEDGGDDSVSGKKVKFLCSFGGRIFPRPSDGVLRYVGGHTRIISVKRDVTFSELMHKMMDAYRQHVVIKYQLPDEDLDALVSVSCPDDLDNMMEEYDKLVERSPDGSAKLRVFLFSASELDPSGTIRMGDLNNSGHRYVDAVNGIMDGGICSLSRKESINSATSTQNSDLSGTEAVDSMGHSQGDVSGLQPIGMSLPKENSATSHDSALKLVSLDPNPPIYAEASAVSVDLPVIKSCPPKTSSQPEAKLERSVPMVVPQQPGMEAPPPATYMQAYVDPRQEVVSHADYVHLPPQMGFPNAQVLTAGPMFTQQQVCDTGASIAPHQFIPARHVTVNTSSSHVGMRQNVIQPIIHPQRTILDNYIDERAFGPRIVQLPLEQSYNSYQVQVPPALVGGGYGWHQVSPQEHVVLSDGMLPNQQVQRDSCASSVSDSNSNYQSPCLEDNVKAQLVNRFIVNGTLGEGTLEQGNEARSRVLGHLDPQIGNLQQESSGTLHNLELKHESERTSSQHQLVDNIENPRISAPLGLNVRAIEVQSPNGAFLGSNPLSCPDKSVPQHTLLSQLNAFPIQTSEGMLQESPRELYDRLPKNIPKIDATDACISYNQLGAIGGRIENPRIHPTEFFNKKEHGKSPVDNVRMDNNLDHWIAQSGGREALLDKASNKFEGNHFIPAEMVPHSSGLAEPYEVAPAPLWAHAGSHAQLQPLLPSLDTNEAHFNSPVLPGIDSTQLSDGVLPPAELKDDISRHNGIPVTKMRPPDVENSLSNDSIVSSITPPNLAGIVQDSSNSLFCYQDPWNLYHDTHFPPPKPNKTPLNIESFATKDPFCENQLGNVGEHNRADYGVQQPLSNLNNNFSQEHFQSSKGSAEEQIKQELQAVAEGVAASVFQPAVLSNSDKQDRNEAANNSNQAANFENSSPKMQHNTNAEDVKKVKLPEKGNLGFPASDSIGRLQIIKNIDLEELRELGSGTFGTVYHGKWRGTDVAIKRINDRCFSGKASEQERMRDDFWNEAIKLADLHHPNVVAFYGVVLDGPEGSVATVTEYMVNGSLRNALQKNEKSLDKRKRLLIAMDVAFGMEYLHGKNIVHFDLKSDNLLVNLRDPHRPICKVGDLGLSKVKCQTLISGGVRGTLPWMAPELLNGSSSLVSEKVDVFSFGIVLWELLTGEEPYADLHYGAIIGGIVSNTLRPSIPESCDPEWRSLMERCWSSEPLERPNFSDIANQLRTMAAKIPLKGQQQHPQQCL